MNEFLGHRDYFATKALSKVNGAVDFGENGVVAPHANAIAWVHFGTSLTNDNCTGFD